MATPGAVPPSSSSDRTSDNIEKATPAFGNGHNGVASNQEHASHWDYGGNPLAHVNTGYSARFPAFAGYLQPGLYKAPKNNIANPAPLGLFGFAFTTFVLSLINWHTRNISDPSIVIAPAFAYGGLCQLLAGMWYVSCFTNVGSSSRIQGNGSRKYFWCYGPRIIWRILDLVSYYSHSRWISDRGIIHKSNSLQLRLWILPNGNFPFIITINKTDNVSRAGSSSLSSYGSAP
jgi:hypothetical protein